MLRSRIVINKLINKSIRLAGVVRKLKKKNIVNKNDTNKFIFDILFLMTNKGYLIKL